MFVQLRWQAKAGEVAVLVSSQRGKEKPRRASLVVFGDWGRRGGKKKLGGGRSGG